MIIDELRKIRRYQDLTLWDIASKIGFSQSTLSKAENHVSDPSITLVKKYAEALGYQLQIVKKE